MGGGSLYNWHTGYYQSYKYLDADFTAKIYRSLVAVNPNDIFSPSPDDVAVHFRRGDFVKEEVRHIYRCFTAEHYLQGLALLAREHNVGTVYIFSDDFEAIQEDLGCLSQRYNIVCVEGNSVVGDIVQMAQFSRFVLANSTFSWWAAFMAETQRNIRVVVPKQPLCYYNEEDSYFPPHWTTI